MIDVTLPFSFHSPPPPSTCNITENFIGRSVLVRSVLSLGGPQSKLCYVMIMAELETKEAWQELLDGIDTLLFDCDGGYQIHLSSCSMQQGVVVGTGGQGIVSEGFGVQVIANCSLCSVLFRRTLVRGRLGNSRCSRRYPISQVQGILNMLVKSYCTGAYLFYVDSPLNKFEKKSGVTRNHYELH